jgi:hypothetical protein
MNGCGECLDAEVCLLIFRPPCGGAHPDVSIAYTHRDGGVSHS